MSSRGALRGGRTVRSMADWPSCREAVRYVSRHGRKGDRSDLCGHPTLVEWRGLRYLLRFTPNRVTASSFKLL
jgi:hypothetical protein